MAGGVAKTFGVVLMVGGGLILAGGLMVAGFGQTLIQNNGGFFGDSGQREGGQYATVAGLGAAGFGLVLLVIGIVLFASGSSRARDAALVEAARVAGASGAYAPAFVEEPAPVAPARRTTWMVIGVIALVLVLVAGGVSLKIGPNGLSVGAAASELPQEQAFPDHLRAATLPALGAAPGGSNNTHTLTPRFTSGEVEAVLNFTAPPGGVQLVLTLERNVGGTWKPIDQKSGSASFVTRSTGAVDLPGDVRARIDVAQGAADVDYTLTLRIVPR